mgnify:CR=1 FL=1
MSDPNRTPDVGHWGRPVRRRNKYNAPQSAGTDAAPVGPVDDADALERAAIIVRADRPAPRTDHEVIGAPRVTAEREPSEPDEHDFKLRDLVTYMAKGLVDHPEEVSV